MTLKIGDKVILPNGYHDLDSPANPKWGGVCGYVIGTVIKLPVTGAESIDWGKSKNGGYSETEEDELVVLYNPKIHRPKKLRKFKVGDICNTTDGLIKIHSLSPEGITISFSTVFKTLKEAEDYQYEEGLESADLNHITAHSLEFVKHTKLIFKKPQERLLIPLKDPKVGIVCVLCDSLPKAKMLRYDAIGTVTELLSANEAYYDYGSQITINLDDGKWRYGNYTLYMFNTENQMYFIKPEKIKSTATLESLRKKQSELLRKYRRIHPVSISETYSDKMIFSNIERLTEEPKHELQELLSKIQGITNSGNSKMRGFI